MAGTNTVVATNAFALDVTPGVSTEWEVKFFTPTTFPASGVTGIYFIIISNGNLSAVPSVSGGAIINGTTATATLGSSLNVSQYTALIPNPSILTVVPGAGTIYNYGGLNDLTLTGVVNANSQLDLIEILTVGTSTTGVTAVLGFTGVNIYLVKPFLPPPFPIPVPDPIERLIPYFRKLEKQLCCLEKRISRHC